MKTRKFAVRVEGCGSSLAAARISTTRIAVNRKGVARVRLSCRRKDASCRGRLAISGRRVSAAKRFTIPRRKGRTLKLKFSRSEVRRVRRAKRMKARATTRVTGSKTSRRPVTIVYKRR